MIYTTNSAQQTFALGQKTASTIKSGLTLALIGDLGSGKTVFAQGVAAGLGITAQITSPTFVIMKIYPLPKHKYLQQFCHIDAYRLKNERDLIALGAQEYLNDSQTIVLIEWAEKILDFLPNNKKLIEFEYTDANKRKILLSNFT